MQFCKTYDLSKWCVTVESAHSWLDSLGDRVSTAPGRRGYEFETRSSLDFFQALFLQLSKIAYVTKIISHVFKKGRISHL